MKYRPDIDGMRAVAVLSVIVYHGDFGLLPGGFGGVDVFFVISGFLITTILADDLAKGRLSILQFYERRARRLLPALTVVTAAAAVLAFVLLSPVDFRDFGWSVVASTLFFANIYFWRTIDYFDLAVDEKPMIHTWSLAVEEQFYLFFPILLILLWKLGPRIIVAVIALIALASLGLAEWAAVERPRANFYLPPTRMWELMAGALAAFWLRANPEPWPRTAGALALVGMAAVCASFVVYTSDTPFPSLWTLAPVGGATLIVLFSRPGSLAFALLSWRPLVAIGLISYSAYLWHQPLFAFARVRTLDAPPGWLMLALSLLSLALAWLSWRWVEQPFRHSGAFSRRAIFGLSGGALAGLSVIGVAAALTADAKRDAFVAGLSPDMREVFLAQERLDPRSRINRDCAFGIGADALDEASDARLRDCAQSHGPVILVSGDSHASDVANALTLALPDRAVIELGGWGCRAVEPRYCTPQSVIDFVARNADAVDRFVFVNAGFWLYRPPPGSPEGRVSFANLPGPHDVHDDLIARAVGYLEEISRHATAVWVGPRIEPHLDPAKLFRIPREHWAIPELRMDRARAVDDAIKAATSQWEANPRYVSAIDAIGFEFERDFWLDGDFAYADGDHWSAAGEAVFGARLAPAVLGEMD